MLAGNNNLVQAARAVIALGPRALVVKHGEYGATLFHSSPIQKVKARSCAPSKRRPSRSKRSSIPPAQATALPVASSAISLRSPSSRPPPGVTPCFTAASWVPMPASASVRSACNSSRALRSTRASTSFARSRTLTEKNISDAEGWVVLAFCMAASVVAIIWSWRHGAMINYGDAIAHLHIARRVFDSRTPRFSELGSVWLPLPHILLLPFVQNYSWWATGLAGVVPSALAYLASCAGIYRLARNWLDRAPAALALIFFALNPNLLYLQTTAMTEPLFLCEFIWIVVWLVEWRTHLDDDPPLKACGLQGIAIALIAAIFTRYDGWIIAFIAWSGIAIALFRRAAVGERSRLAAPAFWLASIAIGAAPILWFVYNSVCFGDWLFFARGPYSAHAIELHTAANAPGWPPHPGWHSPWVALLFYLKVSELDSVAALGWSNLWGNIVLALAALGTARAWLREKAPPPCNCLDASPLAARSLLRMVRRLRIGSHLLPRMVALHLVQHALRP